MLNTRITTLINKCKITHSSTKETLKIMLLAHSVKYNKVRDWIRLQDQSILTYQLLLNHCKSLKQSCEQFQKVQIKVRAELTTLTVAFSITSSIHQDTISLYNVLLPVNHYIGSIPINVIAKTMNNIGTSCGYFIRS